MALIRKYAGDLSVREFNYVKTLGTGLVGEDRYKKIKPILLNSALERLGRLMGALNLLSDSPKDITHNTLARSYDLKEEIISTLFRMEELKND